MVLDATVAGSAANSYLTVGQADVLAATDAIHGPAWLAASSDDRERMLIAATRDAEVFKGNAGTRYSTTQARRFPRAADVDGLLVPYLPEALVQAVYEQAVHLLVNHKLIADAQARRAQGTLSQQDANGAWTAALDPRFGRYAQGMVDHLAQITGVTRSGGRRIVSAPIGTRL